MYLSWRLYFNLLKCFYIYKLCLLILLLGNCYYMHHHSSRNSRSCKLVTSKSQKSLVTTSRTFCIPSSYFSEQHYYTGCLKKENKKEKSDFLQVRIIRQIPSFVTLSRRDLPAAHLLKFLLLQWPYFTAICDYNFYNCIVYLSFIFFRDIFAP